MKYFNPKEFSCQCGCGGGFSQMDEGLLKGLDRARGVASVPFRLTSAYRCDKHNEAVGGVPNSAHTKGHAVDILARSGREKYIIMTALLVAGFNRVGINGQFIHVDNDPTKTERVFWTY